MLYFWIYVIDFFIYLFVFCFFNIDRGCDQAHFEPASYLEWCLLTLYDIVVYLFNSEIQDVITTLCQA